MTDAPRRRWFQLHLSTVIALTLTLTLTAGGLLWANMRPADRSTFFLYYDWPRPAYARLNQFPYITLEMSENPAQSEWSQSGIEVDLF
jgi:hypothetical protein